MWSSDDVGFVNADARTMSAGLISFTLFMDVFHGTPISFSYEKNSIYHSWISYLFGFLLAVTWPCFSALSGYASGKHTLDQIIFGIALAIPLTMLCHFLIRDRLISQMVQITAYHDRGASLLKLSDERSDEQDGTRVLQDQRKYREFGLAKVHEKTLSAVNDEEIEQGKVGTSSIVLKCLFIWIKCMAIALACNLFWKMEISNDSARFGVSNLKWIAYLD